MKIHFALCSLPSQFASTVSYLAHWLYTFWYTTGITGSFISVPFSDSKPIRTFELSRQFFAANSIPQFLLQRKLGVSVCWRKCLLILQQHNWYFLNICISLQVLFVFVFFLYLSYTLPTACFSDLHILCLDDGLMNVWSQMIYVQLQGMASFRLSWKSKWKSEK